jgi:hypothetical protein
MPVSLERLIAEAEPVVISEELTRECIQVRCWAVYCTQRRCMLPPLPLRCVTAGRRAHPHRPGP